MGLDDAIRGARQQADFWENRIRREAERKTRERQEADSLLAEALERLQPYGDEVFFRVRRSPVGRYRGPGGRRFSVVSDQRCWRLMNTSGVHPETNDWYDSPVLLLEDGTAVRVWLDIETGPGQYVSSMEPTPLGDDYFPMFTFHPEGGWVGELKRTLAEAVVKYERGG
ncbi:hypothetical protein [Streptomyces sp. NPDC006140]|uniref:hypothetical protein n=1 Tax=Streptomyces sp. NPDC006140 TaxID=3154579 RepID=UPI0033E6CFB8